MDVDGCTMRGGACMQPLITDPGTESSRAGGGGGGGVWRIAWRLARGVGRWRCTDDARFKGGRGRWSWSAARGGCGRVTCRDRAAWMGDAASKSRTSGRTGADKARSWSTGIERNGDDALEAAGDGTRGNRDACGAGVSCRHDDALLSLCTSNSSGITTEWSLDSRA